MYSAEYFTSETGGEVVGYIPITGGMSAGGRTKIAEIPAAELAVALHKGSFADLDQTYGALGTYVAERETGVDGHIRENYLVTAFETDDESQLVTEVCRPVFQTKPLS